MTAIPETKKRPGLGRLAILGTTLIWSTSFVILKNALDSVPTLYIMAFRFSGAAVIMLLAGLKDIKKLDRSYVKDGAVMGVYLFVAYLLQTYGLVYTTPGKNAFLTAVYCVIVPFLNWIISKNKPDKFNISAAIICLAGMGLVSLQDDLSVNVGDALTIVCGFFFAMHIVATDKYAAKRSIVLINLVQFTVVGGLSWLCALFMETPPTEVPSSAIAGIAYLCVMCTACCYFLQTFGQKHTPPSAVAVILTLEAVFGAIISIIFYGEELSLKITLGFILIFAAILTSETKLSFLRRKKPGENEAEKKADSA